MIRFFASFFMMFVGFFETLTKVGNSLNVLASIGEDAAKDLHETQARERAMRRIVTDERQRRMLERLQREGHKAPADLVKQLEAPASTTTSVTVQ